jgi:hypothetical protein
MGITTRALHELHLDLLFFPVSVPEHKVEHLFKALVLYFGILLEFLYEIVIALSF